MAHEVTTRWHGRSGSPATGYPQPEAPNVGTVRLGEALGLLGTGLAHSSRGGSENGRNRARVAEVEGVGGLAVVIDGTPHASMSNEL